MITKSTQLGRGFCIKRVVKGGLNHKSQEINEVFHDSRKFFEGSTFHAKSVQDGIINLP